MAKKKITLADLIVRLNDDGSIAGFEKKTKKAGKAVDNLSKSEATLNRNFKGASQQSSNQTKNFSKMAQGITGGLVPAYATLAANIFAISAAFRFLQSAGDLRILQQGQAEYAQNTGKNLAILTRQLQAATSGQLAFAEAAQAVAIGTAAGLSAKQINQLGDVALKASLALGRDLTDSFNRLVRGAVKAEPELLDELGIILRLETASEKYALAIGKTKDQLNIFEKSQAVVNEVLEQGEEKFGATATSANELTKLAKSFDDLLNSIKRMLGPLAEFLAMALQMNTTALAGGGILLGRSLLKAVTPALPQLGGGKGALQAAESQFASMYGGTRDISALKSKDFGRMEKEMKNAYDKAAQGKVKSVYRVEQFTRRQAETTMRRLKVLKLEEEAMNTNFFNRLQLQVRATYATYRLEHGRTVAAVKTGTVLLGRAFTGLLALTGYIGIALSIVGVLSQLLDKSEKSQKAYKSAQKEIGNLFKQNAEDLDKMISGMRTRNSLMANMLQSARALSNIDFSNISQAFSQGAGTQTYGGRARRQGLMGYVDAFNNFIAGADPFGLGLNPYNAGMQGGASTDQMNALTGTQSILGNYQGLTVGGSAASTELAELQTQLAGFIKIARAGGDQTENFKNIKEFMDTLAEKGTIAGNNMKNLGSTTQIMTSSAQDFAKALNSFKTPQTQLTRLTTNIKSVGSALKGLGEQFSTADIVMKFDENEGTLFDKATKDMLSTFLGKEGMAGLEQDEALLRQLKKTYSDEDFAIAGAGLVMKYGQLAEKEAKRLHDIEMTMITEKLRLETDLLNKTMGQSKMRAKQLQKEGAVLELQRQQADALTMIRELESKELDKDDAQIAIENQKLDNINAKIRKAKMEASALHQVQQAFRDSFESSMATAFQSIIEGTSNMKDAFLSMTKSILSAMAQVLAQQAAIAVMGAIPFFPGLGPTGRDGGIMKSPGYRSFGTGGVSDGPASGYPAVLHGTEAVVPLPNGRSIPVEMSGGTGGNNVTVNVNMTTGATSSTGDGEDSYTLGRAISAAVQTELSKQQRPGGLLSPY